MARSREFEPEQALQKAMELFWLKGYSNTSMDELVKHTGVSLQGLYTTFGNKKSIFLAALDRYSQTSVAQLLKNLQRPDAGLKEIRGFFQAFVRAAEEPDSKRGCFMCNTAIEMAPHDRPSRAKVDGHFDRMRSRFCRALKNARKRREIGRRVDPEKTADYLQGMALGILVLVRSGAGRRPVRNMVEIALTALA